MKYFIVLFLSIFSYQLSFCSTLSHNRPHFLSPLNIPLVLSGNFGEIRSNHFHSGIDVKTEHRTGLPLYAMDDGYVSRIRITAGSGFMIDIAYRYGVSSTYRHLEGFVAPIMARARKIQYMKNSWEIDYKFSPKEFPVKAGQQVGWSGNMGFSAGPHLHLDMYRTASKAYIDPIPLLSRYIKDHRAPQAETLQIFPLEGKGEVNGTSRRHIFAFGNTIDAWGEIGIALKAHDYMDGTWYRLGVRYVTLFEDGKMIFSSNIEQYSPSEARMVNSWTYNSYMKSFIDPGNTLRMLKTYNGNRGIVTINQERDYHFQYVLKDVFGNTSNYHFTIHGRHHDIAPVKPHSKFMFTWNKTNYLQEPGMMLIVPFGMLYEDTFLNFKIFPSKNEIAFKYQLNDQPIPLNAPCELKIGLLKHPIANTRKYYMVKVLGGTFISTGNCKYENGYIVSKIKDLSTYTLAVDVTPPHIMPVDQRSWNRGKLIFSITDGKSGIKSYHGYIDERFAIFDRTVKNSLVKCDIDPTRVQRKKTHTAKMVVEDFCGNVATYTKTFKW